MVPTALVSRNRGHQSRKRHPQFIAPRHPRPARRLRRQHFHSRVTSSHDVVVDDAVQRQHDNFRTRRTSSAVTRQQSATTGLLDWRRRNYRRLTPFIPLEVDRNKKEQATIASNAQESCPSRLIFSMLIRKLSSCAGT